MHDILAVQSALYSHIETRCATLLHSFGYEEIGLPLLERTELYARSIGTHTDIVGKEMYSFIDRNGDSLTLRPEGTAGCVRAAIEHGLLSTQQRWWYHGPFFRRERPQKGRFRQFRQVGAETFMMDGPDIECELITISKQIFQQLGIDSVTLKINSLGTVQARRDYSEALFAWLEPRADELDADSRKRLKVNPLRILDSKVAATQKLLADAPQLPDYIDADSRQYLEQLQSMLEEKNIAYCIDPFLVRGLDYYNKTVFEWVSAAEFGQNAVAAGGRYDDLVALLGGKPTPAAGFALGIERLALLLEEQSRDTSCKANIYMVAVGERAARKARLLSDALRGRLSSATVLINDCGGGGFKPQLRRANKSGAAVAIIVGEEEASTDTVSIKDLRGDLKQWRCRDSEVASCIQTHFSF